MENLTVTFKEISIPKLTVTVDNGSRIKLPIDRQGIDNTEIINFFKNVVREIGNVSQTLRGSLRNNELRLVTNSSSVVKIFTFNV